MCPVGVYLQSTSLFIVSGATFSLNWGDGSPVVTWTATASGNYPTVGTNPTFDAVTPSNSQFYHKYTTTSPTCIYHPTLTITNHCASDFSANLSSDISVWDNDLLGLSLSPAVYNVCEGYGGTFQFTDAVIGTV